MIAGVICNCRNHVGVLHIMKYMDWNMRLESNYNTIKGSRIQIYIDTSGKGNM